VPNLLHLVGGTDRIFLSLCRRRIILFLSSNNPSSNHHPASMLIHRNPELEYDSCRPCITSRRLLSNSEKLQDGSVCRRKEDHGGRLGLHEGLQEIRMRSYFGKKIQQGGNQGHRCSQGIERRPHGDRSKGFRTICSSILIILVVLSVSLVEVDGFGLPVQRRVVSVNRNDFGWKQKWRMSAMEDENDFEEEVEHEAMVSDFGEEDLQKAGVMIEDLNWRVAKLRLEEANKRRFLKAKPVFLPYEDCSKWVQAWGQRWKTAEEWYVACN
jgi:hypothetical protein